MKLTLLDKRWTPSDLFHAGDTGDWWDVSNSQHVWTTSSRTTIAGNGDVIGSLDGLKNGNNLTAATTARPTRTYGSGAWYALFDGSANYLSATFTMNQPCTRISAIRQVTWTSADHIYDGTSTNTGALIQYSATPTLALYTGGVQVTTTDLAVDTDGVVVEQMNGASSQIAINTGSFSTGNSGSGNPGGLTVGALSGGGSQHANMRFYGGIIINRLLNTTERYRAIVYFGRLAGLYF